MTSSDIDSKFDNNFDVSTPPRWFQNALSIPVERGETTVAGVPIKYRAWGIRGEKGVLLIHGGAAHAQWWDHLAPFLATTRRVVAIDLSGHGDSGRRASYSLDIWTEESQAVCEESGIAELPVIVGHSMGGLVALRAASRWGEAIAGVITVDTPIRTVAPEVAAASQHSAFGPLRVYPNRAEILARFRPIPDQESLPYIKSYIAEKSIREVQGGWTWKFDPKIFSQSWLEPSELVGISCRVAMFRAESGLVEDEMVKTIHENINLVADVIEIPDSGHAIMLDQPLALVTGLRTILSGWELSRRKPII